MAGDRPAMIRPGHGGEHRLAVNGHLGVLDDDVRPPSSVQNHPPTVGIEYVRKDVHAIGLLMLSRTLAPEAAPIALRSMHQGDTRRLRTIAPRPARPSFGQRGPGRLHSEPAEPRDVRVAARVGELLVDAY